MADLKRKTGDNRFTADNMTTAEKDSAVKKINERYTDICREFGPNSTQAREYYNAMVLTFGEENMHTAATRKSKATKRKTQTAGSMGIKLINRDKKMLEKIDSGNIQALLEHHTAGQIKETARREAEEESKITGRNVTPDDILAAMDYVDEYLAENAEQDSEDGPFATYWKAVGNGQPRPSYMTLADIIASKEEQERLRSAGSDGEADYIEDQLIRRLEAQQRDLQGDYFG